MPPMKECCVKGCSLAKKSKEVLYAYPSSTTQRYKRWSTLFPNSFLLHTDRGNFICRRHFTAESFDSLARLRHSADPSVNIDTSFAQDKLLKNLFKKVIFEYSERNKLFEENELTRGGQEACDLLGISELIGEDVWFQAHNSFRKINKKNGLRYGKKEFQNKPTSVFDIIMELRSTLPSNFNLPIDKMDRTSHDVQVITINKDDDNEKDATPLSQQLDENRIVETASQIQSVDNYLDVLMVLKPLEAYISRIGNEDALFRLKEIEKVVKLEMATDVMPRKRAKTNMMK